jgi:transcriptional regulator with XRE-family HTH domain
VEVILIVRIPLGQKIKKIRELKNLTQEHVADKLGITQSNYSKLEMGKQDIPFGKLEETAHVLNTPLDQNIDNKNPPKKSVGFNYVIKMLIYLIW